MHHNLLILILTLEFNLFLNIKKHILSFANEYALKLIVIFLFLFFLVHLKLFEDIILNIMIGNLLNRFIHYKKIIIYIIVIFFII
jgi:hypothetical protein